MDIIKMLLLALSITADSFIISLCIGTKSKYVLKTAISLTVWFCIFQIIMFSIGYFFADFMNIFIKAICQWISFFILIILSIKMIIDSTSNEVVSTNKSHIMIALSTSFDAMAVGFSGIALNIHLLTFLICLIFTCFVLTFFGTFIGNRFGSHFGKISYFFGGTFLMGLALKILIQII